MWQNVQAPPPGLPSAPPVQPLSARADRGAGLLDRALVGWWWEVDPVRFWDGRLVLGQLRLDPGQVDALIRSSGHPVPATWAERMGWLAEFGFRLNPTEAVAAADDRHPRQLAEVWAAIVARRRGEHPRP